MKESVREKKCRTIEENKGEEQDLSEDSQSRRWDYGIAPLSPRGQGQDAVAYVAPQVDAVTMERERCV